MKRTSHYKSISPVKTKDSSQIRELIHQSNNTNTNQSIAEAQIATSATILSHYHHLNEEIYLTIQGTGKLYIQKESDEDVVEIDLQQETSAVILPGESHGQKYRGG